VRIISDGVLYSKFYGIGPISFLAWWYKRLLDQASVSFGLVCEYVSSFLLWLFGFYLCLFCEYFVDVILVLVRHAPLGVRSAKRRHQSPEWTILSHSYRLIQGEIVRP